MVPRRVVPHPQNAVGLEDLSVDYQEVIEAAAGADKDGLGARRAAVVLGWDSACASPCEGARARLARLVVWGRLEEAKPGKFTLPTGQQADEVVQPGGGDYCESTTPALEAGPAACRFARSPACGPLLPPLTVLFRSRADRHALCRHRLPGAHRENAQVAGPLRARCRS